MKFKTLELLNHYNTLLEQGQDPSQPPVDPSAGGQPQDAQDVVDPNASPASEEELPMTSQGENQYIADLIDAALFAPTPEEARTLLNLQNVMQTKRFTNAREEVLPLVLSLITSKTTESDLKNKMNDIN